MRTIILKLKMKNSATSLRVYVQDMYQACYNVSMSLWYALWEEMVGYTETQTLPYL